MLEMFSKTIQFPCGDSNASPRGQQNDKSINNTNSTMGKKLVGRRRKLKSSLYFAYWSATVFMVSTTISSIFLPAVAFSTNNHSRPLSQRKHEWIERSVHYYSTVMRKNTGQQYIVASAQLDPITSFPEVHLTVEMDANRHDMDELDKDFVELATKHYYARILIKMGKWTFAEKIYRRIIDELTSTEDNCDHTKLAVSTLLLALHMQRTGDIKATRAVFLNFFRRVALAEESDDENHKCKCSAKVIQAYALFEMKNGLSAKSLEIIQRAVKMDEKLKPVLEWKQFRDAAAGRSYSPTFRFRSRADESEKDELLP